MSDQQQQGEVSAQQQGQAQDVAPEATEWQRKYERADKRAKEFEGKLAEMERQLQSWSKFGDPERVRALVEEKELIEEELRKKDPAKEIEHLNRRFQTKEQEYQQKLGAVEKEAADLKARVKTLTVTDRVWGEIADKFIQGKASQKVIRGEIEARGDIDEDGTVFFKDENGDPLYSKVNRGQLMTAKEFGDLLADEYAELARTTSVGGAKDATTGHKVAGRPFRKPSTWAEWEAMPNAGEVWGRLTPEEKLALAKTKRMGT